MAKRKVCVFIGGRANYSSIKSAMREIKKHEDLELSVVVGASAVLDRFGMVEDLVRRDGFEPDYTCHSIVEGGTPVAMAKSAGLATIEAAMVFHNLDVDYLIVVGDRFEIMAVVMAAAYMNIHIAHTMGGEVSGTIDESIRHAVTKFAHVHFPANEDARQRIIKLGEDPSVVFNVGCPRIDLVAEILRERNPEGLEAVFREYGGVGPSLDLTKSFLLVSQHPVTTEFGDNRWHVEQTLDALAELEMPTVMLWPNVDAGGDEISKAIRTFRENTSCEWLHVLKNLPIPLYVGLMDACECMVGNSSSGIREGAYIGVPVVNIGTRQCNRARAENVLDVGYSSEEILNGIRHQLTHGKYPMNTLYGDGTAGARLADMLAQVDTPIQKAITY